MHRGITFTLIILTTALSACTSNSPSTDPSLVGSWQGMREEHGKCQFLSWNTNFETNGRFSITFFPETRNGPNPFKPSEVPGLRRMARMNENGTVSGLRNL